MPLAIKKYKVVRRGPKWCVRVQGGPITADTFRHCQNLNISFHIRQPWSTKEYWDYDFIFDKEYDATVFILGYL
jgi:hypothetical protein